ncbi:hypothetical protein BG000_003259 [Podila horticola]|nr:hypothetical protein BG000_003259 [Podila horticola]
MPSPPQFSRGSSPSTPTYTPVVATPPITHIRSFASTTVTELAISEAHYLSLLKASLQTLHLSYDGPTNNIRLTRFFRVGNALNLANGNTVASGQKGSATIRVLIERWTAMMRMHIKFHDDIVSVNDNAQEAATLLNGLRIDPYSKFNKDSLAHLSALVNRVQMIVEANQHPRGMLKRISTFARGVIRRPSSAQLLIEKNNAMSAASPKSPSNPSTPISFTTTEYSYTTTPTGAVKPELPVKGLESTAGKVTGIEDTKSLQNAESTDPQEQITTADDESSAIYAAVPLSRQHRGSSSDMGSIGSMTLAPSTESLRTKDATVVVADAKSLILRRSAASQQFLDEREARKATLRLGAQAFIQSKAESLQAQSPTFVSRPSIDRLRTITRRETETKPPVKSLISFWEQTTEPIEV